MFLNKSEDACQNSILIVYNILLSFRVHLIWPAFFAVNTKNGVKIPLYVNKMTKILVIIKKILIFFLKYAIIYLEFYVANSGGMECFYEKDLRR